ncbi:aminopeptidase P family protein [Feifania hominis]|uniref:Xaa-Pro aminopeptidase n=1 Tax=Feifania hominis TaxID=2763660 RepID=A0A926DGT8_9FIRM|nr:aminopeptidase P family protein [Feifania hominis]MBC8537029.1 aminopeptidase P N-terminal domain-containing protein [Feifania hominis]
MDRLFFTKNREKFAGRMADDSMAVFFSGIYRRDTNDQLAYPFSVDRNFYYFTGIDRDNMILLFWKSRGRTQCYLFLPPVDEHYEKWQAKMMRPAEAAAVSGIENVLYTYQFETEFDNRVFLSGSTKSVYLYSNIAGLHEPQTLYAQFADRLRRTYPAMEILNPLDILTELRGSKEPEEVELTQQAVDLAIGALTHTAALMEPGIAEYQIKAHYIHYLSMHGSAPRFRSVVAAGKNATILHYNEANYVTGAQDMVLMDVGALNGWYVSDLTRTFPVSGRFTPRQREVYDIVLEALAIGMDALCVGTTEFAVNAKIKEFYAGALKSLGLIDDAREVERYYFHGSGHPIGLDLHDYRRLDRVIPKNCLHTMEPGLYIPEWGIGIRIEDNVLVTEDGVVNLSQALPRTANDVENMVAP